MKSLSGGFVKFKVTELGAWSGPRDGRREAGDNKVYTVSGSNDLKIKRDATVRSAVQSAEMLDDVITMGCVIVEPIR